MLLDNGTRPEFRQEDIPEAGYDEDGSECAQPLLLAVTKLDLDMVSLLLNKGADPNVWCSEVPEGLCSDFYHHILFGAVEHGNKFRRHLDVQDKTKDPRSLAMVNVLLDGGADPSLVDGYGQPPLTYASRAGDETPVQCLPEYGADPHQPVNQLGQKLTSVSEMKESIRVMLEEAEARY